FSNKWAGDKQNVNGSYRYNRLGMRNIGSTLTENILPDTATFSRLRYSNQNTRQQNLNQQHAFNGKWEWKPDSLTTIKLTTVLTHRQSEFTTETDAESLTKERELINTSDRLNIGTTEKRDADNNLTYKRNFKKAGRLLNASVRLRFTEDDLNSILQFENRFYKNNLLDSTGKADQQKLNHNKSSTLGAKLTYVEPLNTKWSLIFSYAFNQNNANSNRNTFDRSSNGKYETLNTLFSNNFDMDAQGHSGSLLTRFNTKKLKFGLGSGVSSTHFDLENLDNKQKYNFKFLNFTPQANLNLSLQSNTNLFIGYNGNTVQPTIEQLQPLRNNTDPLNIVIGNPNLEVGFRHSVNIGYYSYKMLKQMGLWTSLYYTTTNNAISNNTIITPNGARTSQAVNVDGNSNWN
ncbi:MAG: hypothetical protein EON98_14970, partial [Chitinophagaceae bacterium]